MNKQQQLARLICTAMLKCATGAQLDNREWDALSYITLVDRSRLEFSPDNCRYAETDAERAENLRFYRSLGTTTLH